jgi:hypothetical protein
MTTVTVATTRAVHVIHWVSREAGRAHSKSGPVDLADPVSMGFGPREWSFPHARLS